MARDYKRDYSEIVKFAEKFIGKDSNECMDAYTAKRKMVWYRTARAFWAKVEEGSIQGHYDANDRDVFQITGVMKELAVDIVEAAKACVGNSAQKCYKECAGRRNIEVGTAAVVFWEKVEEGVIEGGYDSNDDFHITGVKA